MMRSILVILWIILVFPGANFAQTKSALEGRWKSVSMESEYGYFNFKTDSFAFPRGLPPRMDSAMAKAFTTAMATMLGEYIYVFEKSGKFEIRHNGEEDGVGSYSIDLKTDTITTIVKRNNVMATEKMLYKINNKQLYLTMPDWEEPVEIVLEKLPEKE